MTTHLDCRLPAATPPGWRHPVVGFCAAMLALSLALLAQAGMAWPDLAARAVLLGVVLPAVTWLACRGVPASVAPPPRMAHEGRIAVGLLVWVLVGLSPLKQQLLSGLGERGTPAGDAFNLAYKLALFVVLPWLVLRATGSPVPPQGHANRWQMLRILLAVSALGWALQALIGSEFRRLVSTTPATTWLLAVPLCWAWMSLEAGLVEEFFFRRWLQTRLEAFCGSPVAGLLLGAIVFGLAHAPGMWLRGAGAADGLGDSPSLLTCMAYTVATQGLAGLLFGVLWLRTRSLALAALAHGMFDVPSNLPRFMAAWGF